jgi:aminoglycoside phosphotransferase (APT) family kinase protein
MPRNLHSLAAAIESYLGRPGSITEVVPLATGYSNQTFLLRGADIVLRTPPEGRGLLPPYDIRWQHDVLADVHAHAPDVPVPRVHGWSEDESIIGVPFYLCEPIQGEAFESVAPQWFIDAAPEVRLGMCEQWFAAVAALHRATPLASLGAAQSPDETYRAWREIAAVDATAGGAAGTHGPAVIALLDEILDRTLVSSGPPTPVHGDPKIGNTMWQDGRLTALLDWELAFNGEPLCDLAYILNWFPADPQLNDMGLPSYDYFALPGMYSRAEVIAAWERGTGRDAHGIEAYEAAESAKTGAIVLRGIAAHEAGILRDERLAFWPQALEIYLARTERLLAACLTPSTGSGAVRISASTPGEAVRK